MDTDTRLIAREMRPRISLAISELQTDVSIRGMLDFDILDCDINEGSAVCRVAFSHEGKESQETTLRFDVVDELGNIKENKASTLNFAISRGFSSSVLNSYP